jgi:hypothetical protein
MDDLDLGWRDFLDYKDAVIAQNAEAVADVQGLEEFLEFYGIAADVHGSRDLIFSLTICH